MAAISKVQFAQDVLAVYDPARKRVGVDPHDEDACTLFEQFEVNGKEFAVLYGGKDSLYLLRTVELKDLLEYLGDPAATCNGE